jgi:hypothetical protein
VVVTKPPVPPWITPAYFLKLDFLDNGIEPFFDPGRAEMAGFLEFCLVLTQHLNIDDIGFVHDIIRLPKIVIRYIIKLLMCLFALLSERLKNELADSLTDLRAARWVELHSALAVATGTISV